MTKRIVAVLLLLCSFLAYSNARVDEHAQVVAERNAQMGFNDTIDRSADDFVTAYVVIADPGTQLYSVLGHCALRLKCPSFDLDYIFSYESEDAFNKVLSFLAGHLKMALFPILPDKYCQSYANDGRGVRQYKLHLSAETKQELWRVLDEEAKAENVYDYDYYHRGCANSCVRFVEKALQPQPIQYAKWERNAVTGRELVREHTQDALWTRFVLCFISGNEVDKPLYGAKQLLIPTDLVAAWQSATVNGEILLDQEEEILVEGQSQTENSWFTPLLFALLILLLSIANLFWEKSYFDWLLLGGQTLIGVAMTYLLFVSDLCCTDWNWLYIAFNPLPAIGWKWREKWVLPYLGIQLLWCIAMMYMLLTNKVLADWPHILLALAFALVLLKQSTWMKNKLKNIKRYGIKKNESV